VHVVGFAVELDQLDIELSADCTHDVFAEGEHLAGEHRPPERGHEHQVRVQRRHAQKNFPRSVRDRAPGLLVGAMRRKAESAGGQRLYEFNPKTTALSQTCLCGDRKKSRFPNGSTAVDAASRNIGTCSQPTSDYMFEQPRMVPTGWTCRQPTPAGCTVRTSTPAEVQPQHHATGEAADTRPRGGQWRASRPGVKPKPRCDRAGRHELPPPTGPRRCPHEQRDSRRGR
jgi:hypothetical protein